ncbi:MAG: hypothetical protein ACI9H8_002418 [Lysobacterales bacterium]|jgi:hypothetical protein
MKKIVILIFLLVTNFAIYAQDSFSTVEERMTGKEFMESGLSKLTDSELDALNKWLRDHSIATMENRAVSPRSSVSPVASVPGSPAKASAPAATVATTATGVDKRGFEGKDVDLSIIVSPLIGEFKGWDGETVFKLQNGMIWKQSENGRQITKILIDPVVTIKPGMFNSWNLSVEGYNRNVQVKRIQ